MLCMQGWKHFLSHQPTLYVNEQVVELYYKLTHDKESNAIWVSNTILEWTEISKEYTTIDIVVVSIVRQLFQLTCVGNLLQIDLKQSFVDE